MMFAAHLSHLAGKLSEAALDRHRDVLTPLGLPTTHRDRQWPKLEDAMKRDKKTRAGLLRFVVLDRIGRTSRLEGPDPALLLFAYAAITEERASHGAKRGDPSRDHHRAGHRTGSGPPRDRRD